VRPADSAELPGWVHGANPDVRVIPGLKITLYNGRLPALKTKSTGGVVNDAAASERDTQQPPFTEGISRGKCVTLSRIDCSERPLRTSAAKPRNTKGKVRAMRAKNENPVAVVFST